MAFEASGIWFSRYNRRVKRMTAYQRRTIPILEHGNDKQRRKCILLFLICGLLAACTQSTASVPTGTPTKNGALVPYHSPTPSHTVGAPTGLPHIPVTPDPTATPFMHQVVKGETMLGIALKYGISLEDLKAANPEVDPGFLVIDSFLVIPLGGQIPSSLPTPTPLAVRWSEPLCYPTGDGGLWCFLSVENDQPVAVENLSAWIGLFGPQDENFAGKVAISPLNVLQPNQTIPLIAFFAPPVEAGWSVRGELLTALAVSESDPRYLDAEVILNEVNIDPTGLQAKVSGEVWLPSKSAPSLVWLAAVAYDKVGNIVGVRRWEANAPCGTPGGIQPSSTLSTFSTLTQTPALGTPTAILQPSSTPASRELCVPFKFSVYSLGEAIERVELLVEARP
jgi:hypothetical protein